MQLSLPPLQSPGGLEQKRPRTGARLVTWQQLYVPTHPDPGSEGASADRCELIATVKGNKDQSG